MQLLLTQLLKHYLIRCRIIKLMHYRGGQTSLELSLIMTFKAKLLFVFADSAVASTVLLLVLYFRRPLKVGRPIITSTCYRGQLTMFLHGFCRCICVWCL